MKLLCLYLSWFSAVMLAALSLPMFFIAPLAGAILISMALFLLPPVRQLAYAKTNKIITFKSRSIIIFTLFIALISSIFVSSHEAGQEVHAQYGKEQAEAVAQLEQEAIHTFSANREQIISELKEAISQKDFTSAVIQSGKYLGSGDEELKKLHDQAKRSVNEELSRVNREAETARRTQKTAELLEQLKTIPTKEFKKNRDLYQQLLDMHPESTRYKDKTAFYSNKIAIQLLKEEKQLSKSNAVYWSEEYKCEEGLTVYLRHIRSDGSTKMRINGGALLHTATKNNFQDNNTTYTNQHYTFYDFPQSIGQLHHSDNKIRVVMCRWVDD